MLTKGGAVIPWVFMVGSPSTGQVLGQHVAREEPGASQLWDAIVQAFDPSPARGTRTARPRSRSSPTPAGTQLRPHLDALGIGLTECESLRALDELLTDLIPHRSSSTTRPG